MSAAHHPHHPLDESILDAWFEQDAVHCELEVAPGADRDSVHAQMLTLLNEAATGQFWAGRWKPVDLEARVHVLRVTVGEEADLGDGHVDTHHSKRTATRVLIDGARSYLASLA